MYRWCTFASSYASLPASSHSSLPPPQEEYKREKKTRNMLTPARLKALWAFKSTQMTAKHKQFLQVLPKK